MTQMGNRYETDRIVGAIMLGLSLCGACGIATLGGLVGLFFGTATKSIPPDFRTNSAVHTALPLFIGAVMFLMFAVCLLNAIISIGVMKSSRRAMLWASFTTGLGAALSLTGGDGFVGVLPNLVFCIYCIMRLNGNLGPKPT